MPSKVFGLGGIKPQPLTSIISRISNRRHREYFQKKARQEVYQIQYLQLEEARQEYEAAVFVLFYKYLIEWIPELLKRKELEELEKTEEFEITYGAYMGEQYCLYKRKEEKKLSR